MTLFLQIFFEKHVLTQVLILNSEIGACSKNLVPFLAENNNALIPKYFPSEFLDL